MNFILNLILADDGIPGKVNTVLNGIEGDLQAIGYAALILGIAVGGLMRLFAYGNERRVAMSNVALSCAVIGFVIVMLAGTLGGALQKLVGN